MIVHRRFRTFRTSGDHDRDAQSKAESRQDNPLTAAVGDRAAEVFYRVYLSSRYCSDDCAEASRGEQRASRNPAMVEARSETRAAARADRRCANPDSNKPLTAQRASMKFCSIRCRVAAHRAQ